MAGSDSRDPRATEPGRSATIRWDDGNVKRSRADLCSVAWAGEEVVLSFGVREPAGGAPAEHTVRLTERIRIEPHVARQLGALLARIVSDYEERCGPVDSTPARSPAGAQ